MAEASCMEGGTVNVVLFAAWLSVCVVFGASVGIIIAAVIWKFILEPILDLIDG